MSEAIALPADTVWLDHGRLGVAIVQGDKTAWESCSRCGGHGMVDYGGSIGECSSCGGTGAQRAQGERGRFTNHWLAPQAQAQYDKPCETCGGYKCEIPNCAGPCPRCPDCRDGRQVWTVRWPCPNGTRGVLTGFHADCCERGWQSARATIQVVPVVRPDPTMGPRNDAVTVLDHDDFQMVVIYEYIDVLDLGMKVHWLPLDPLPTPGRDFAVIVRLA